jgi:flagellar biosynthesis/type III secretory pathway protein FliH
MGREARMPGVIRRDTPLQTRVLSLGSIEQRAAEIMRAAELRSADLAKESRLAAEAAFEAERKRGYQQGLEEGRAGGAEEMRIAAAAAASQLRQEAKQDLDLLIGTLRTAIGQIESERRRLLAEAESGLLDVALSIGRRVCGIAVRDNPAPALALARELLHGLRNRVDVELRVNPAEHDSLEAAANELLAAAGRSQHVAIIADPEVTRGGARLVSREGSIDATIETQLERIAQTLMCGPGDMSSRSPVSPQDEQRETPAESAKSPESPDA